MLGFKHLRFATPARAAHERHAAQCGLSLSKPRLPLASQPQPVDSARPVVWPGYLRWAR